MEEFDFNMDKADFYNMSDDLLTYDEAGGDWHGRRRLIAIVSTILIVVGCVGNGLSAVIFARRDMRVVPTHLCLLFLAVVDTFMLVIFLGNEWLHVIYDVNLTAMSYWYCVTFNVAFGVASDLASFLVVGIAICHCLCACCCPYKKDSTAGTSSEHRREMSDLTATVCRRLPLVCVWVAVFVTLCIVGNLYATRYVEMGEWSSQRIVCFHHFDAIRHIVKPVIQLFIVASLIPLLVYLAFCSTTRSSRATSPIHRPHSTALSSTHCSQQPSSSQIFDNGKPNESLATVTTTAAAAERVYRSRDGDEDAGFRLTVTVLALCITLLITHTPVTVVTTLSVLLYHQYTSFTALCSLLWYSNFAIKIAIYVMTSPNFRRRLLHLTLTTTRRSESREAIAMVET